MKKIFFICFCLFYGFGYAQNYYEVPYVGTKSKLTKLTEGETEQFLLQNEIQRDYTMKEKEAVGFSENIPIPAKLIGIYREDIPDEKGNFLLTAYRLMYVFVNKELHENSITVNLDDSNIERRCVGQKIYYIRDYKADLYYEGVYFGNSRYKGSSSIKGVTAENIQFKINSGNLYAFKVFLSHLFMEPYGLNNSGEITETKGSGLDIYKDSLKSFFNRTRFSYVYDTLDGESFNTPLIDKNNPFRYSLQNAFDDDKTTSYVPAGNKLINLDIEFDEANVNKKDYITGACVINGYAASDNLYKKNNRIKTARYAYKLDSNIPIFINFSETLDKQYFKIKNPRKKLYFTLNETEVFDGSSFNDNCIAEINIKGKNYGWYFGEEYE